MQDSLRRLLVTFGLELLDYKADRHVLVAVVVLLGIDIVNLKTPLVNQDDLVT